MYIIPSKNSTRQNTQSHRATDTTHDTPQSLPENRGLGRASDQGELGGFESTRHRVLEKHSLSNKILKAEPVCGTERYSVTLDFKFPLTFSRSEAKQPIRKQTPEVSRQIGIQGRAVTKYRYTAPTRTIDGKTTKKFRQQLRATELEILDSDGVWARCQDSNGVYWDWIPARHLQPTASEQGGAL